MPLYISFFLFLLFPGGALRHENQARMFNRAAFYTIMSSGKLSEVNNELDMLKTSEIKEKQGYEGALLIRKAGLVKIPAEKLHFFKLGYIKLEGAIADDKDNTEYHFLRLTIQEHAPHIVKYYHQIDIDKDYVIKGYKNLPLEVQDAVKDYCKNSKVLNLQDF
jgi:hypothetical protein